MSSTNSESQEVTVGSQELEAAVLLSIQRLKNAGEIIFNSATVPEQLGTAGNPVETDASATQDETDGPPTKKMRPPKSEREAARCVEMQGDYLKRDYKDMFVYVEANYPQTTFNEDIIADLHSIAKLVDPTNKQLLLKLWDVKKKVNFRQEVVYVRDKYGKGAGTAVDKNISNPISKETQRLVDDYLRNNPRSSAPASRPAPVQPFLAQRGGEPRDFYQQHQASTSRIQGPFTSKDKRNCFNCGKYGHWRTRCPELYGATAFRGSSNGRGTYSTGPRSLFNLKGGKSY